MHARAQFTFSSCTASGTGTWVRWSTRSWLRLCTPHSSSTRQTLLVLQAASLWSSDHDSGSTPLTGVSNFTAGFRNTTGSCAEQKSLPGPVSDADDSPAFSEVLAVVDAAIFLYQNKTGLQEITAPEEEGLYSRLPDWQKSLLGSRMCLLVANAVLIIQQ